MYLCRPCDQFPLIRTKFGSASTDRGLLPHATAAVCFVLFFFLLLPVFFSGEGNLRQLLNQWGTTHSLTANEPASPAKANTPLETFSKRRAYSPPLDVLLLFFNFYITAFQLEYCCFKVASVGLLSLVRVITSVSLLLQRVCVSVCVGGVGNESFCFPRSHNFPSEVLAEQSDANLDVCDHFFPACCSDYHPGDRHRRSRGW